MIEIAQYLSCIITKFKLSDLVYIHVCQIFCLHHYKMQKLFVNKKREKIRIYFIQNHHKQKLVTFDNINNLLKHLFISDLTRKRYHYIIFKITVNSYIRFVFKLNCWLRHLKPPIQKRQPLDFIIIRKPLIITFIS